MNSLESYGPALVSYEGAGKLTLHGELGEPGIVYKGYFEAQQSKSGGIVVSFLPISQDTDGENIVRVPLPSRLSFYGRDLDDWAITDCGQSSGLPIFGPLGAPENAVHPASVFRPRWIKCKRKGVSDSGYDRARFFLSNFLWHYRVALPEPIKLNIGNLAVTISPCDDYMVIANSTKAVRGIAQTAEVMIETSDASRLVLNYYSDFMDNLVSVLRLITGNRVDWFYAEGFKSGTDWAVERFHKDAITGPFSITLRYRRYPMGMRYATPKMDIEAVVVSFLEKNDKVLDVETLKELINYFINACDETSFLEARGLLASTLLDLIVLKYAEKKGAHNVMEEKTFKGQVFRDFKQAIKCVKLPEPSNELLERAREQLQNAFRRSFRKRLNIMTEGLDLPVGDTMLDRAVKIRNKLVHEGTYLSENTYGAWSSQYKTMIWINLLALCRLTGYRGHLPELTERGSIEV